MSATLLRRAAGSAVALGLSLNSSRFRIHAIGVGAAICAMASILTASPVTADGFSGYVAGNASSTFQTPGATLGNLNPVTGSGSLNPFNPAFKPTDIAIVGVGGSLTLHLSENVQTTGQTLGVYSNVGYKGSGETDSTPSTLGQVSQAVVSVSQDGNTWVPLNSGAPISFGVGANYYTDVPFANPQPAGSAIASQSKPWLGKASQLANKSYSQIVSTFNGSAGGTWLDLSQTGLPAVNYVRFNGIATGQRMVIDAIGGLGATNTLSAGSKIISESVGAGVNTSDVVVDFNNQHAYDFQVHYNGSITGTQALDLIHANSDFRYMTTASDLGTFVSGFDYAGYDLQEGPVFTGSNYWGYYQSTDGNNWTFAHNGADSTILTNGSYDGWLWQTGTESTPLTPVATPEPTCIGVACFAGLITLLHRRRKTNT